MNSPGTAKNSISGTALSRLSNLHYLAQTELSTQWVRLEIQQRGLGRPLNRLPARSGMDSLPFSYETLRPGYAHRNA